jgi:hypothetical protein
MNMGLNREARAMIETGRIARKKLRDRTLVDNTTLWASVMPHSDNRVQCFPNQKLVTTKAIGRRLAAITGLVLRWGRIVPAM